MIAQFPFLGLVKRLKQQRTFSVIALITIVQDIGFEKIKSIDSNISEQNKVSLKRYLLIGANILNSDKIKYLLASEIAFIQSMERSKSPNFLESKLADQMLSVIIPL